MASEHESTAPAPRKRASRRASAPTAAPAAAHGPAGDAGTTDEAAPVAAQASAPSDQEAAPDPSPAPRKRAPRKRAAARPEAQATPAGTQPDEAPAAPLTPAEPVVEEQAPPAPARKRASRRKAAAPAQAPAVSTPAEPSGEATPATGPDEAPAAPAPRKRASRRKAAAPAQAPAGAPGAEDAPAQDQPAQDEQPSAPDAPVTGRARARRAGSARTGKAAAATNDLADAAAPTAPDDAPVSDLLITELSEEETQALLAEGAELAAAGDSAPPAPTFGLIFQAPDPAAVEAPRRRRASAPAGAPVAAEESPAVDDEREPEVAGADSEDADGDDGGRRRRRRGGKGRRRSGSDEASSDAPEESGEGQEDQPAQDSAAGDDEEPSGRRRTRRRRRSGAAGDSDDPPGTVTRVREPRRDRDEATGIKGSTRLEAKKQRRREGREAGRRRTVITEAEFLARRESVDRVMVVRQEGERTQIGVLEDGILVEHYVSKADSAQSASMAGNVYLGRVQNVLPSMEAAFVDIGRGRNAVLYAGEVNWDAAGLEAHRSRRIENALSSGQGVLVQVTKDPIGHKGARLTSQVSLPGRYLVYVPQGKMTGISRKLPDTERARLKKILKEVVPADAGVIVRTAAEGASEAELRADVERLTKIWDGIQKKAAHGNAPALLHGEVDLTVKVIRDVFNEDFSSMVVAGDTAWETVNDYLAGVAPDLASKLTKWTGTGDVFAAHRIDEQLAKAMDRKVWLPSGGSLVIDRTEAMTVIDVNTGKFVGAGGNLEETVTKNNIEAAEEIVRQLRLRDIGGIIVIDFIDMVLEANRDLVVRRLLECLGRDRTKHQVAEVTSLGLVQMTRKRVGAGLIEVFSEPCEHCAGRGIIVSSTPVDRPTGGKDAGSGGGHSSSGSGSTEGGRRRRGRGSSGTSTTPTPATAPERPAPNGPTPAQIAAAAYAALHTERRGDDAAEETSQASGAAGALEESPAGDTPAEAGSSPREEQAERPRSGRTGRVRRGAGRPTGAPAEVAPAEVAPAETAPTEATRDEALGEAGTAEAAMGWPHTDPAQPVAGESTGLGWPSGAESPSPEEEEQQPPAEPEAIDTRQAQAEAPAPAARPRRRRGRVSAPAGPPRPAAEGGDSPDSGA